MASKKYTINTLMQSIPEVNKVELKPEGECFKDVVIQVRTTLPLEDAMGFVRDIVATCVDDENAAYSPELFDFAVRLYTLMYYANIDLSKDAKKAYQILYNTGIFDQVSESVQAEQLVELIESAEKKIEHWKNILSSSVAGKVADLMKKMEEVMAGSEQMMETIDGDEFKAAVARLADAGILNGVQTTTPPSPIDTNDSIAHAVTPDDMAKANTLMAGLSQKTANASNVIYMKKK